MHLLVAFRRALISLPLLVVAASDAYAQPAPDLFAAGEVQEIRLVMHGRDAEALHERYLENTFYAAELHWQDTRIRHVAVRSRGSGSRNREKPGLLIEINRYVRGQTLAGRTAIVLDNLVTDPSMVREYVAMGLFARMGQAAPLEAFVRLYINDEDHGIYTVIEDIDQAFLGRAFGDSAGYLYEFDWLSPYYFEDLGDDLRTYRSWFESRSRRNEPLGRLYGPVRDMVAAVNEPSDELWRSRVEEYVNLPQLIAHVAIETFLSEADGFLGFEGMKNFYLYRPSGSLRHEFIPWDRDNSFGAIDSSIFQRVDENVLVRRALSEPDLLALYLDVLEQTALAATVDGWLAREIGAAAELTVNASVDDVRKPYSNEMQLEAVAFLLEFAETRPAMVLAEVAQARAAAAGQ
jgi:spore coat protein CotH